MIYPSRNDSYLSDDLERRLIQRAIEEQFRFRPLQAIRNLFKGSKI